MTKRVQPSWTPAQADAVWRVLVLVTNDPDFMRINFPGPHGLAPARAQSALYHAQRDPVPSPAATAELIEAAREIDDAWHNFVTRDGTDDYGSERVFHAIGALRAALRRIRLPRPARS